MHLVPVYTTPAFLALFLGPVASFYCLAWALKSRQRADWLAPLAVTLLWFGFLNLVDDHVTPAGRLIGGLLTALGAGFLLLRLRAWVRVILAEQRDIRQAREGHQERVERVVEKLTCTPHQAEVMLTWAKGDVRLVLAKVAAGDWSANEADHWPHEVDRPG